MEEMSPEVCLLSRHKLQTERPGNYHLDQFPHSALVNAPVFLPSVYFKTVSSQSLLATCLGTVDEYLQYYFVKDSNECFEQVLVKTEFSFIQLDLPV